MGNFYTKKMNFKLDEVFIKNQELKTDSKVFRIRGYASTFGNIDSYNDIIEPTAFDETIEAFEKGEKSIKILYNHEPDLSMGLLTRMGKDEYGLFVEGDIATDLVIGAETAIRIKRGIIDEFSIGYYLKDWYSDEVKPEIWHLTNIDLREVSVVTFAANERARVTEYESKSTNHESFSNIMKSLEQHERNLKNIKNLLKV